MVLAHGLKELGLLKGKVDRLIKKEAYRRFYMHRTGHWLGMDVHDVGDYKVGDEWREFEPGMVLTVEPGIYISPGIEDVPRKWWNIAVRIEDDVLVTEDGCEVLSASVPKAPDEIEAIMVHRRPVRRPRICLHFTWKDRTYQRYYTSIMVNIVIMTNISVVLQDIVQEIVSSLFYII